jgi:hypothetical protein
VLPSEPSTSPTLISLLTEVEEQSGILRFHSSGGALDAIVEMGQLTALRIGGRVKDLEMSPFLLLEHWGQSGGGQFWPDRDYKGRTPPSNTSWRVQHLLETLLEGGKELDAGLKLPLEHDLYAALRQSVTLEPPLDTPPYRTWETLWNRLHPLLEQGLSVGEMSVRLELPIFGLGYALARLRREKVIQKLTPTLDFVFNLEGFGGFGSEG